ncbi:MAG TPA: hypothetical protein DDY92_01100 [Dialister sp.]|nr:hypothetical protein [Dialister sp.]
MTFWAQEKEKLTLWWSEVSTKEIGAYFLYALLPLLLVFGYYQALGITGLFAWYRCLRSMFECGLLLFLTQLMTHKSLFHPFWRIGYIPFFSWVLIFPYVITHARNGIANATFNDLSPYFLTAMAIELLLFFIMNVICRVYVGKKLATLICLCTVCFFSFNAFIFYTHYAFMGIMMTAREMFFVLTNTSLWMKDIVLTHISWPILILWHISLIGFAVLYAKWIYRSAYELDAKWVPKRRNSYSVIHRLLQFLVFFGCVWLLIRWASECFPLHDYEAAKAYIKYIEMIRNSTL